MRICTLALLVGIVGCSGDPSQTYWGQFQSRGSQADSSSTPVMSGDPYACRTRPAGEPADFFPTATGTYWRYEIEVSGQVTPLRYAEVSWPLGSRAVTYATRGVLYPTDRLDEGLQQGEQRTFALEMRVKGPATEQGPLRYPQGVELAIDRDDLGVFSGSRQVFWAVGSSGRYMVNLVATYPPDSPGAPTGPFGTWGQEDGSAIRLIFFGDKPGIQISLVDSPDQLLFEGLEAADGEEIECLTFLRTVEASEDMAGPQTTPLDKGFTEQMWFARGKGLVRLVQRVDGVQTMTWTLTKFTPGT